MSVDEIAKKHAPLLVLHPNEKFYPFDVQEWFQNTEPIQTSKGIGRRVKPPLDASTIAPFSEKVPILYREALYSTGELKTITYFIFFANNGSKRIAGVAPTGGHTADLESVYIEFQKNGEIAFIGLSTHGDLHLYNVAPEVDVRTIVKQDKRYAGEIVDEKRKIEFIDGRPVVYAAINAHALYGAPGSYMRFGGFGNDVAGEGPVVRLVASHLDTAPEVKSWEHYLGEDGVGSYFSRNDASGRPKHFDKARPHFGVVPEWSTYFAYVGYAILPLLLGLVLRKKKVWIPVLVSIFVFFSQFFLLKLFLRYFGRHVGIKPDIEPNWLYWFLPFRFF